MLAFCFFSLAFSALTTELLQPALPRHDGPWPILPLAVWGLSNLTVGWIAGLWLL